MSGTGLDNLLGHHRAKLINLSLHCKEIKKKKRASEAVPSPYFTVELPFPQPLYCCLLLFRRTSETNRDLDPRRG